MRLQSDAAQRCLLIAYDRITRQRPAMAIDAADRLLFVREFRPAQTIKAQDAVMQTLVNLR